MMKTKIMLTLLVVALPAMNLKAADGGITFQEGSWEEAVKAASESEKMIFVDFYASWCGPCKWMSSEVFTDAEVGAYFNEHFINVKIDAEYEEFDLVEQTGIEAFPTLAFFKPDGSLMIKITGAREPEGLISLARQVKEYPERKTAYFSDRSDYEKFYLYLESEKIFDPEATDLMVKEYLEGLDQEDLKSAEAWALIRDFYHDYGSDIYRYLIDNAAFYHDHYADFEYHVLDEALSSIIKQACEQFDPDILQVAKDLEIKVRKVAGKMDYPEDYYRMESDYIYFQYTDESEKYYEVYANWVDTYHTGNWQDLLQAAINILESFEERAKIEKALSWSDAARDLEENVFTNYITSLVYYNLEEYQQSLDYAEKAQEMTDDWEILEELNSFITDLKTLI